MKLNDIKNPNDIDLTKLHEELDIMHAQLKTLINKSLQLNEDWEPPVGVGQDDMTVVIDLLDNTMKQFNAAKRGLGIANKLTGPDKRKHASKVLSNMNKIRAAIRDAERQLINLLRS